MSVITITACAVVCDACGQQFLGYEGEQLAEDPADICSTAAAYGWAQDGGRHICSDCRHTRGIEVRDIANKETGK